MMTLRTYNCSKTLPPPLLFFVFIKYLFYCISSWSYNMPAAFSRIVMKHDQTIFFHYPRKVMLE